MSIVTANLYFIVPVAAALFFSVVVAFVSIEEALRKP